MSVFPLGLIAAQAASQGTISVIQMPKNHMAHVLKPMMGRILNLYMWHQQELMITKLRVWMEHSLNLFKTFRMHWQRQKKYVLILLVIAILQFISWRIQQLTTICWGPLGTIIARPKLPANLKTYSFPSSLFIVLRLQTLFVSRRNLERNQLYITKEETSLVSTWGKACLSLISKSTVWILYWIRRVTHAWVRLRIAAILITWMVSSVEHHLVANWN